MIHWENTGTMETKFAINSLPWALKTAIVTENVSDHAV